MAIEKIKTRNGATLTSIVVIILLAIGIFTGAFLYWQQNTTTDGNSIEEKYSDIYYSLNESQTSLENNTNNIKDKINDIQEADNSFQVAWNSMRFVGSTLKISANFIETTTSLFYNLMGGVSENVPAWVIALAFIGILAFVTFIVIALLKGEQKM